jgi:hypothetical protein
VAKEAELPIGFEDLRGQVFQGRYELDELVRVSSRHVTYAGCEREADRGIVLDLLRPTPLHDRATLERFERRIAACGRVGHPVVHEPIASGELVDGKLYVVSKRPAGEPLDRYLHRHPPGRLHWADARPLLLELVRGLAGAHTRGVVHCALSPGCCWVDRPDFGQPSLRVLDLGLNTDPSSDEAGRVRSRTTPLGRDAVFAAPETAGGVLGDERSDVYLVGLVAWFMLVGRPPFQGTNPFQLVGMHLAAPVPAMQEAGAEVPPAVEAIVRHMLAKEPHQRPVGMTEIEQSILELDEDGRAVAARAVEQGEAKGRQGRARARQARAGKARTWESSREDAVEWLEGGAGKARGVGRRLPGQEIVDARWGAEPGRASARPPEVAAPLPRASFAPYPPTELPMDPGQDSQVEADAGPRIADFVPAIAAPVPEERTALLSSQEISELWSADQGREPNEGNPQATTGPPPASISRGTVPLTREQVRALRAEFSARPPSSGTAHEAAPAVPPAVTGGTERMTPAEVRALRLAALGGVPIPASPSATREREPEVAPTQVLLVDGHSGEGRTSALSSEQLAALRVAYGEVCSEPKKDDQ